MSTLDSLTRVAKFNPETGKVEWKIKEDIVKDSSFAVFGCVDFKATGLPGQPQITSRAKYKELLKRNNCVVVGNDSSCRPPERA